jgi:hypothetical protein
MEVACLKKAASCLLRAAAAKQAEADRGVAAGVGREAMEFESLAAAALDREKGVRTAFDSAIRSGHLFFLPSCP